MMMTMKIFGLQKLTLLDYPGKTAATIFLSGCDFSCPFCHNAEAMDEKRGPQIDTEEVIEFLKTRQNLLDGVCISGGEPLLQEGIKDFCKEIKNLGFDIKLDTNGQRPELLKELTESRLVDYVAMDIKNSLGKYGATIGIKDFDTSQIEASADYLLNGTLQYEFRTTVVKEFHTPDDFHLIGQRFKGAAQYYLQKFRDLESVIEKGLNAYSTEEMEELCEILKEYNINAILREVG